MIPVFCYSTIRLVLVSCIAGSLSFVSCMDMQKSYASRATSADNMLNHSAVQDFLKETLESFPEAKVAQGEVTKAKAIIVQRLELLHTYVQQLLYVPQEVVELIVTSYLQLVMKAAYDYYKNEPKNAYKDSEQPYSSDEDSNEEPYLSDTIDNAQLIWEPYSTTKDKQLIWRPYSTVDTKHLVLLPYIVEEIRSLLELFPYLIPSVITKLSDLFLKKCTPLHLIAALSNSQPFLPFLRECCKEIKNQTITSDNIHKGSLPEAGTLVPYCTSPQSIKVRPEDFNKVVLGNTPFTVAIQEASSHAIGQLIMAEAPINSEGVSYTPLIHSIYQANPILTGYLLNKGASVDAQTKYTRNTPLHLAIEQCNNKLLSALLLHKPNTEIPNRHGQTPLLSAVTNKNYEAVKLLLDHGADPNYKDVTGRNSLASACSALYQLGYGIKKMMDTGTDTGTDTHQNSNQNAYPYTEEDEESFSLDYLKDQYLVLKRIIKLLIETPRMYLFITKIEENLQHHSGVFKDPELADFARAIQQKKKDLVPLT